MASEPRDTLITVFGGSGFIGRHVVRALARRGYRVRAAMRRPDLAGYLQPMGAVGQVHAVQANLRPEYRWSVERAIEGADAVINAVGILSPTGRQTFGSIHVRGAQTVAEAAARAGIGRFVHLSAIGADAEAASDYARSKAAGEAVVRAAHPGAVILRPSVVFGPEDDFFNKIAGLARIAPVLPLFGGGETKFQPVYVGDVAEAVVAGIDGRAAAGGVYELGGPEIVSFRECFERVLAETGRKRPLVPVPAGPTALFARLTGWAPYAPLTTDQARLLKTDTVVGQTAEAARRTLAGLGIQPTGMAAILPTYLWRYRAQGEFDRRSATDATG